MSSVVLLAMSLHALKPDSPVNEGIKTRFNKEYGTRCISLNPRRHLLLHPHNPPSLAEGRVFLAKYEQYDEPEGGKRPVLSDANTAAEAILLYIVLPPQHSFGSTTRRKVLLQNSQQNSVAMLLIAQAGLLIRLTPKRAQEPVFVYVTQDLDVIFDSKEVVASHGAFR